MPGSHWMIVMTPENFDITRSRGFDLVGLKARHRKKAERMASGDRILYYVSGLRVFPATATVTSAFFEDHAPIWLNTERKPDVSPWRVRTRPNVILQQYEYIDANQLAPRLLYTKRWSPEDWPLAFQGQVHLLSSADFSLIEGEMRRTIDRRKSRRERPPRRPRESLGSPTGLAAWADAKPTMPRDAAAPSVAATVDLALPGANGTEEAAAAEPAPTSPLAS